jgi:murein DD-endopeptidase MepM/ murein hydrolase activator NlpD
LIGISTAVASLSIGAGVALAGGGGIAPPDPPRVTDVQCVSTCAGLRKATVGSRVELVGRRLADVSAVSFIAAEGGRVRVVPLNTSARSVKAKVPEGAATGKPRVEAPGGSDSSPVELKIVRPDQIPDGGDFELSSAKASPQKVFFYSSRNAKVTYSFQGEATDVRIQVVRRPSGKVVKSWVQRNRQPFVANTAKWGGSTDGGNPAGNGKYRFKVGPRNGALTSDDSARFTYYNHKFPVRGRHSYGDGIGAGRGHQGQDVFAKCGTRTEAARGGRVQVRQYHSSAGYYIVIDGKGTGRDYVYMHMKKRGRISQGVRVRTGQRIGYVGETGNASGCHVHFEIWSGPGWYEGGHFTNPTDDLKAWDSWS